VFVSRLQLVSFLSEVRRDAERAWCNVRRVQRRQRELLVHMRVTSTFLRLRHYASGQHGGAPPGAAEAAMASGGDAADDVDEESPDDMKGDTKELLGDALDDMKLGGEGVFGGGSQFVAPMVPALGGLGKSIELVGLGVVRVATGLLSGIANAFDGLLLALPWGARLVGVDPEVSICACRLGEALRCVHAWNMETLPGLESAAVRRLTFEMEVRVLPLMLLPPPPPCIVLSAFPGSHACQWHFDSTSSLLMPNFTFLCFRRLLFRKSISYA
jgi:hypothetical protein